MAKKFSYSKIDTFAQCGFKYKLRYVDGHYIFSGSLATDLGTAVHAIEETIANTIKAGQAVNYTALKNKLIFDLAELEHKFPEAMAERDKSGRTTKEKIFEYLSSGIFRLEKFLMANNHLEVIATEKEFNFVRNGITFHGYIDRILYDHFNKKYIVQDIKTYAIPIESKNLATPLQFVVYVLAMKELFNISEDDVVCSYDLPFCDLIQAAGTSGFMKRGTKKLDELLNSIDQQDFKPNPTPLCHWCEFCPTNPNQVEEGKNLCPYHSLWTKDSKNFAVAANWEGLDKHETILLEYINRQNSGAFIV